MGENRGKQQPKADFVAVSPVVPNPAMVSKLNPVKQSTNPRVLPEFVAAVAGKKIRKLPPEKGENRG